VVTVLVPPGRPAREYCWRKRVPLNTCSWYPSLSPLAVEWLTLAVLASYTRKPLCVTVDAPRTVATPLLLPTNDHWQVV